MLSVTVHLQCVACRSKKVWGVVFYQVLDLLTLGYVFTLCDTLMTNPHCVLQITLSKVGQPAVPLITLIRETRRWDNIYIYTAWTAQVVEEIVRHAWTNEKPTERNCPPSRHGIVKPFWSSWWQFKVIIKKMDGQQSEHWAAPWLMVLWSFQWDSQPPLWFEGIGTFSLPVHEHSLR